METLPEDMPEQLPASEFSSVPWFLVEHRRGVGLENEEARKLD